MQTDKLDVERVQMLLAEDEEKFSRKEDILSSNPDSILYHALFDPRDKIQGFLEFRYKVNISNKLNLPEGLNEQLFSKLRNSSLPIIRSNYLDCSEKKYSVCVLTDTEITKKLGVIVFSYRDQPSW